MGVSGPSLLMESTDSTNLMIIGYVSIKQHRGEGAQLPHSRTPRGISLGKRFKPKKFGMVIVGHYGWR